MVLDSPKNLKEFIGKLDDYIYYAIEYGDKILCHKQFGKYPKAVCPCEQGLLVVAT
jgi:hypothetical protein